MCPPRTARISTRPATSGLTRPPDKGEFSRWNTRPGRSPRGLRRPQPGSRRRFQVDANGNGMAGAVRPGTDRPPGHGNGRLQGIPAPRRAAVAVSHRHRYGEPGLVRLRNHGHGRAPGSRHRKDHRVSCSRRRKWNEGTEQRSQGKNVVCFAGEQHGGLYVSGEVDLSGTGFCLCGFSRFRLQSRLQEPTNPHRHNACATWDSAQPRAF